MQWIDEKHNFQCYFHGSLQFLNPDSIATILGNLSLMKPPMSLYTWPLSFPTQFLEVVFGVSPCYHLDIQVPNLCSSSPRYTGCSLSILPSTILCQGLGPGDKRTSPGMINWPTRENKPSINNKSSFWRAVFDALELYNCPPTIRRLNDPHSEASKQVKSLRARYTCCKGQSLHSVYLSPTTAVKPLWDTYWSYNRWVVVAGISYLRRWLWVTSEFQGWAQDWTRGGELESWGAHGIRAGRENVLCKEGGFRNEVGFLGTEITCFWHKASPIYSKQVPTPHHE